MIIITILGYIFATIICLCVIGWAYSELSLAYYKFIIKIEDKGVNKFLDRQEGNSYWISNDDRKPFGEFHSYIFTQFRKGGVSGNSIRDKVDEIIDNYSITTFKED